MKKILVIGSALVATLATSAAWAAGRDALSIVGSSTVYPFSTVVAEQFGKGGTFKTPKVESTGTGGGIKLFCGGVGVQYPDIANASRKMKPAEFKSCQAAGVKEIVEVKIGYDGIVIAQSKKSASFPLTRKDIYLALAKQVPDPECSDCGKLIDNPYKTWSDVNSALPNRKIEVMGPPPTSGTRDAFVELAMEKGCEEFEWIKDWKKKKEADFKKMCQTMREDGGFIEAGENDNLIVQKLLSNPNSLGIFGYSFLEENTDKVAALPVEGVTPDYDTISSMQYSVSRPLFFYVKKAHVGTVPGIQEFVTEFTSEKAWGDDGYLTKKGFIPLPEYERKSVGEAARQMKTFSP
ncbi:PstS family phosphate ABC transporter substrate-binding protein [Methylolobus aquaticus]|nr:PstS family phosphate ABC transporter substrate-binding protein [Methylolobus aquaticus]